MNIKKILVLAILIGICIIPIELFSNNQDNCNIFTKEGYVCYLSNYTEYTTFKLCDNLGTILTNENEGELFFIHDSQKEAINLYNFLMESYKKGYQVSIECHVCKHGYCNHYYVNKKDSRYNHDICDPKKKYNLTHALNCKIKIDSISQNDKYGIIIKQPSLLSMETISIGTSFLQLDNYPYEFIEFSNPSSSIGLVDWKYFIRPYEKTKLTTILLAISLNKKLIAWIDTDTGHISSVTLK